MGSFSSRLNRAVVAGIASLATVVLMAVVIVGSGTRVRAAGNQEAATIPEAIALAKQTGHPVTASSETTETTTVQANPDGTLTADISSGPVQEPDPSHPGEWAAIDLSLQSNGGTIEPTLSAADTTFSDGGPGVLATLSQGSDAYTEQWGGTLPAPILSGDTATYPAVLPGIDLQLQARTAGFEQSFLVHSPPQHALVLDVPLALRGLTAQVDDSGGLLVTDAQGNPVATAGTAIMWGSTLDPHTGEPVASDTVPTEIVNGQNGPVLEVRPESAFFVDPAVTYPVTIDPSPNLSVTTDTFVRSDQPDASSSTDTVLKSGFAGSGATQRTLVAFPNVGLTLTSNGAVHVLSATLNLYETSSYSCTASEVGVSDASASWDSSVTWNTQPSVGTLYASTTAAKGYSASCPAGTIGLSGGGANGHTLADLVQNWADGATNYGMVVKAASESDPNGWKKFWSSEHGSNAPTLSITYNSYPTVPANLSATDTSTWSPVLHATFADPDGGTGQVEFTVFSPAGDAITTLTGTTATSGQDSSVIVKADLQADDTYTWQATAFDGIDRSAGSAVQSFLFSPPGSMDPDAQLSLDANTFDQTMQSTFGSRYGFTWITNGVLDVGILAPTTTQDANDVAAATPPGDTSQVVPVTFSADQLNSYLSTIDSIMGSAPEAEILWWGLEPNNNHIEVHLTQADQSLTSQITSSVPSGAVSVVIDPDTAIVPTGDSRWYYPPYKAGRVSNDIGAELECTLGFIVIINQGEPGAGLNQGTTAGHCAHDNEWINAGNQYGYRVGVANTNKLWPTHNSPGDSSLIGLSNQADATNKLYVNGSFQRSVTYTKYVWDVGQTLVESARSGVHSGVITNLGVRLKYLGHIIWHSICFSSVDTRGGDSGGPVYEMGANATAGAAGLVEAVVFHYPDGKVLKTCFDPMPNVNNNSRTHTRIS